MKPETISGRSAASMMIEAVSSELAGTEQKRGWATVKITPGIEPPEQYRRFVGYLWSSFWQSRKAALGKQPDAEQHGFKHPGAQAWEPSLGMPPYLEFGLRGLYEAAVKSKDAGKL